MLSRLSALIDYGRVSVKPLLINTEQQTLYHHGTSVPHIQEGIKHEHLYQQQQQLPSAG